MKALVPVTGVKSFNPRAHAGRDKICWWDWPLDKMFQSTRPRGARLPASDSERTL